MKTRLLLVTGCAIAMLLLWAAASQDALAQSSAMKQVSYQGISFTYDTSLAADVEARTAPERITEPNEGEVSARPQHIVFEFKGYAASGYLDPAIYVFPVRSEYMSLHKSLNPGTSTDIWLREVNGLRVLLSQRPDLRSLAEGQFKDPPKLVQEMPFLPPINAAVFSVGKHSYLGFRNGSGVRYLAQVTQDASLPDRENTGYTFQGLTNDGKYYVAARFAAFPATPPPTPTPSSGGDPIEQYRRGMLQVMDQLDQTGNSDYQPNLDLLDEMIESLRVDSSVVAAVVPTPRDIPRAGNQTSKGIFVTLLSMLGFTLTVCGLLLRRRQNRIRKQQGSGAT